MLVAKTEKYLVLFASLMSSVVRSKQYLMDCGVLHCHSWKMQSDDSYG